MPFLEEDAEKVRLEAFNLFKCILTYLHDVYTGCCMKLFKIIAVLLFALVLLIGRAVDGGWQLQLRCLLTAD